MCLVLITTKILTGLTMKEDENGDNYLVYESKEPLKVLEYRS